MLVYSKKIARFIETIKSVIKEILSKELRLKVLKERFYDAFQFNHYPINVVIYNNKSMLGYFDAEFYELGFHERLMFVNKDQLHTIIRHELAHYMTFLKHGYSDKPHGLAFKTFCQSVGWGDEISAATICLEEVDHSCSAEMSSTFRKVQKLMALAASRNPHEAELAMIKSQQLLLKHNVDKEYIERVDEDDDDKIFLKRILKQKKANAKMQSIARILNTFFVNTVYNHSGDFTYLEIVGSLVNLEIAEYVANVLQHELDWLWEQAKQQHYNLKGLVAKNSFFLGIARGYCNKIEALKTSYGTDVNNALIIIEKKLVDAQALIYSNLTKTRSSRKYCPNSSALGERVGQQLNFNSAINQAPKNSGCMIS